ncbi:MULTISPECIES: nucleotidyltransferase substrate binding protein [Thermoanaerobacter]|jgi:nucleotidyltransferase substrate binding protein (TIGR01987 family)|uniref:Nucleotidyltransferase substrate binding protein, HI0074 family n=1 Tax=Thermoanaerobacter italicus (strain DSM 9252 / Ab9) TaxID=580331 RepID=D3T3Z0_THEIA|nr:nucleotidyltransferase substrate binding protein [Thermoanaerobacter italicus]ADD02942.1 nucleotidyltransferase substrate binding protein, HI0074 family [Thermoanaerobacter italicus Ab9]
MTEERLREKLSNYKKALSRLEEALKEEKVNQYVYDSVIKRFEFTYELAWKLMKAFIEYKGGNDVKFPRDIFKEAFATGIVEDGEVWLSMIRDRNLSSHTYNQEGAIEIYNRIKNFYWEHLKSLAKTIEGGI